MQQYKLITQDQFSKCAGGDRSKLYRSTEQELKQRNVLNLRDALEYICVYMTYKNSQTMKAEESMSETIGETIDRIKNMKYFVSYVQQLWQEVLLAKKVSNSEQQISEAPESLEQVLDSIFYRVFSDESDVPMKHSQTTDMVLLHKVDWPDMYEMATLIALCKYSYVPFCFATTDQQLPYQTYDTLDLSLV